MNKIKQEEQLKKQAETIQRLNSEIEVLEKKCDTMRKLYVEAETDLWDATKALEGVFATPCWNPWKMHEIAERAIYGTEETDR